MRNERPGRDPSPSGPRPELAFWLSAVLPGLGQIYAGAPVRGALFFVLAFLGLAGILNSDFFSDPRPRYQLYGVLGALVMGSAWSAAAWHARSFSEKSRAWPAVYRFFAGPRVRRCFDAARAELLMAVLFLLFLIAAVASWAPEWLPEPPRYWFLYEVFAAFYLAVFHGVLEVRVKKEGLEEARLTGFLVVTLLATASLLWITSVPVDVLLFAYVIALPSCWFSLRKRGRDEIGLQARRFFLTLFWGFGGSVAYGLVVVFWELVSGNPQYEMSLVKDETVVFATIGLFYYLLRAATEAVLDLSRASEGDPRG
jgi:hypothetical protein